jgi:hypothetical protein
MPKIKSLDLDIDSHRKYLRHQIASLKRSDPSAGKNYQSFIQKLLNLFSDNPPIAWRFAVTTYKFPIFRVFNKRTGRVNDFLGIFPEWGMAITPSINDEKFRHLFPHKGAWYSSGDQVNIDFSTFSERKQFKYIEGLKVIIESNKDFTLNFSAYT